jgi:hypothetical protein
MVGVFLYFIVKLLYYSFISAVLWAVFITQSTEGWGWTWLFFLLTYSAMIIVYYLIVLDIINIGIKFISDIFKGNIK